MAPESVSFRITRHTETLAETIHTLSQRLLQLEQRLTLLERQLSRTETTDPAELHSLENVERLLQDCRQLLEVPVLELDLEGEEEGDESNVMAA
ncbi:MAG: hypothetical protein VKJ66_01630 [Synechococcus sp.]|nr:hypothetical protein [Synechococcus sp.]